MEGLTRRRPSSETWPISTSGIVNYPWGRYTIWRRAAAKRKWATFSRGWRRASTFTEGPRSGHLKLVASSTELRVEEEVDAFVKATPSSQPW